MYLCPACCSSSLSQPSPTHTVWCKNCDIDYSIVQYSTIIYKCQNMAIVKPWSVQHSHFVAAGWARIRDSQVKTRNSGTTSKPKCLPDTWVIPVCCSCCYFGLPLKMFMCVAPSFEILVTVGQYRRFLHTQEAKCSFGMIRCSPWVLGASDCTWIQMQHTPPKQQCMYRDHKQAKSLNVQWVLIRLFKS